MSLSPPEYIRHMPGEIGYIPGQLSNMEITMEYDIDKIDQTVLALLSLTLHDVSESGGRAWKGHDWDVLNRLHEKGWISNPASKAKSVVLSPGAIEESKRLFAQFFGKH